MLLAQLTVESLLMPFPFAIRNRPRHEPCGFDMLGVGETLHLVCPDIPQTPYKNTGVNVRRGGVERRRRERNVTENRFSHSAYGIPENFAEKCVSCGLGCLRCSGVRLGKYYEQ